jgi:hypothetical protein
VFGILVKKTVAMTVVPACTVAQPATLFGGASNSGPAALQVAMLLATGTAIDPHAVTREAVRRVAVTHLGITDAADAPFNRMLSGFLLWAAKSAGAGSTVSALALQAAHDSLLKDTTVSDAFAYSELVKFIKLNFVFELEAANGATAAAATSASIFPMIPALTMTRPDGTLVDFAKGRPLAGGGYIDAGEKYFTNLTAYFDQLAGEYQAGQDALQRGQRGVLTADGQQSLATIVFRDFLLMLTRSVVQSALDTMARYPFDKAAHLSLNAIAGKFPVLPVHHLLARGETLADVARRFGVAHETLVALNANSTAGSGEPVLAAIAVTAADIVLANPDTALLPSALNFPDPPGPAPLPPPQIWNVLHQVQAGQSLEAIATLYNQLSHGASLSAAAILAALAPGPIPNSARTDLLQTGAVVAIPSLVYSTTGGDSADFITAFYMARNPGIDGLPGADWYRQAVGQLNPLIAFIAPLAAGTQIEVPSAPNVATPSITYGSRPEDTLDWIADTFWLVQLPATSTDPSKAAFDQSVAALKAANPGITVWTSMAAGVAVTIPGFSHVIGPSARLTLAGPARLDSLDGLVATFPGLTLAALTNAVKAQPDLLAPLAVVPLPPISHQIIKDETLGSIARAYNLALEALAPSLADYEALFADGTVVTVPNVPSADLTRLVGLVCGGPAANSIAASLSRFNMHGLRLPDPTDLTFVNAPVDKVFNGEIAVATYGMADLTGQQFPLPAVGASTTVTLANSGVDWITFKGGMAIDLAAPGFAAARPALRFDPEITVAPAALPLFAEVHRHYPLTLSIHWQAAVTPNLPVTGAPLPGTGEPTLWMFPSALLAMAKADDPTTEFALIATTHDDGRSEAELPVSSYAWATLMALRIRRVPSPKDDPLPNTYLVLGADETGRDLLLDLWHYLPPSLDAPPNADTARLLLLIPPNATGDNPSGLESQRLDRARTVVLKTNLSTRTTSGGGLRPEAVGDDNVAPVGEHFAGIDAPKEFAKLLWEASVTGSGGFYLTLAETASGAGLPAAMFDQNNEGVLHLLCLLDSQTAATPSRSLKRFNNCAAVADCIDTDREDLAALATTTGHDIVRVATVNPGSLGFELTRTRPVRPTPPDPSSPEDRTRQLFSLLGFTLRPVPQVFRGGNEGLPVGPTIDKADTDPTVWRFRQVLQASRRAARYPLPVCAALPANTDDPYAGMGAPAILRLTFHDVFGNITAPATPLDDIALDTGYTDAVIGLAQWPGLGAHYRIVQGEGGSPAIVLDVAMQWSRWVPGAGGSADAASTSAAAARDRYRTIYFQIQQADVTATLGTSLQLDPAGNEPTAPQPLALPRFDLAAIANGAYAFAAAAARLTVIKQKITAATLQAQAVLWNCDAGALLELNSASPVNAVFAAAPVVPLFRVVAAADTLDTLIAGSSFSLPSQLLSLDQNARTAIVANTLITVPPRPGTVLAAGESLAALAARLGTTTAALAIAPNDVAGLLAPYAYLTVRGTTAQVEDGQKPSGVVARFKALGVETTVAEIFVANQDMSGLAVGGCAITVDTYLVATAIAIGDLTSVDPAWTLPVIADGTVNREMPGLLTPGASLAFGTTSGALDVHSLGEMAGAHGISLAQIAAASAAVAVQAGTDLILPDTVALNDTAACFAPHTIAPHDTFDGLSPLFGGADLATLNVDIAGLLTPGLALTVKRTPLATIAGDSIASYAARFPATAGVAPADVIAVIRNRDGVLRPGAVMLCPLPAAAGNMAVLAGRLNVVLADLLQANLANAGLFLPGTLTLGGANLTATAETSLLQAVNRFSAQLGRAVAVEEVLAANASAIATTARLLLPPGATSLAVALAAERRYPDAMFPITVTVTLARDKAKLHPDFAHAADVLAAATPVPPLARGAGGDVLSLVPFAGDAEAALGAVKIASSRGQGASPTEQLWLVNFASGPAGNKAITRVAIARDQPAFFALPPLSTAPISRRRVPVRAYLPGEGLAALSTLSDFQGVDLDIWARSFLAALDLILSPTHAHQAFSLVAPTTPINPPHAAFEQLVSAKNTLAQAIAGDLVSVFSDAAGDRARAAESFRQDMLVNLGAAYAVDVVVQYPTRVTAQYADARGHALSGRVHVPQPSFTIPKDGVGFAEVAAAFSVSSGWAATVLAGQPRLLTVGNVLSCAGSTQPNLTVTESATLATVAAYFAAPLAELPARLAVVVPAKPLFAGGTTFAVTGYGYTIAGDEPLASVADQMDIDVVDLGRANLDSPGFFAVGAKVSLILTVSSGPPTHVVTVTDPANTLASLVAAMSAAFGRAVRLDEVVDGIAATPGLLARGLRLHMMTYVPQFSIPAAKMSLDGDGTIELPVKLEADGQYRKLVLALDYQPIEIEAQIESVADVDGYRRSSWLSFVVPLDQSAASLAGIFDTGLGRVEIPLPLRAYPAAPTLMAQSAHLTDAAARDLETAKLWTYEFTYSHADAAQDAAMLTLELNGGPSGADARTTAPASDLIDWLAQFATAWPNLQRDLALLADPTTAQDTGKTTAAVAATDAMGTIAGGIAATWATFRAARRARPLTATLSAGRYEWTARTTLLHSGDGGAWLQSLRLEPAIPGNRGPGGRYPAIACPDGRQVWQLLPLISPTDEAAVYQYPTAAGAMLPAFTGVPHRFSFAALDLASVQSARAGAEVTRNRQLTAGRTTREDFVYRTPQIMFPDPLLPYFGREAPVPVGAPPLGLADAIRAAVAALVPNGPPYPSIELTVGFGSVIVTGGVPQEEIASTAPLRYRHAGPWSDAAADQAAAAVQDWITGNALTPTPGNFAELALRLYSSLAPDRPLLALPLRYSYRPVS